MGARLKTHRVCKRGAESLHSVHLLRANVRLQPNLGNGQFRLPQEPTRHLFGMLRDFAQVIATFFGNLAANGANFIYNQKEACPPLILHQNFPWLWASIFKKRTVPPSSLHLSRRFPPVS